MLSLESSYSYLLEHPKRNALYNVGAGVWGPTLCAPPVSPCPPQAFQVGFVLFCFTSSLNPSPRTWFLGGVCTRGMQQTYAEQKELKLMSLHSSARPFYHVHLHLTSALFPHLPPHHSFPSHHPFFLILSLPFSGLRVPGILHLRPAPRDPARRLTRRLQAAACRGQTGAASAPQRRDWGLCHRLGTNGAQHTPRGPQHGDS